MKVLYIHSAAAFGGSSKSLIEVWCSLAQTGTHGVVICPRGAVADQFRRVGLEVVESRGISQWDNTRFGYYRSFRWLVLLREVLLLLPTLWALYRVRDHGPFDVIHTNEITLLPIGVMAKRWLAAPLVVHVRSLQRVAQDSRCRWFNTLLRRHADAVVAIDETVRRTLPSHLAVAVVHNSLRSANTSSGRGHRFRFAIVGVLHPSKGVYEFVEAAAQCLREGMDAEFWIVGENPRKIIGVRGWLWRRLNLAQDVRKDVTARIKQLGLEKRIIMKGFVEDIGTVYSAIDVLCFPSRLDAPGRPVFEAAFHGVPSIVAVRDPLPDTAIDGETALCIPEPQPRLLALAMRRFYDNKAETRRLGDSARQLAHRYFDAATNARDIMRVYRGVAYAKTMQTAL